MTRDDDPFPRVSWRRKGYSPKQVEALLRLIEATLLANGSGPVTAGDIRRAGFELVRGGYEVTVVDAALDAFEEEVLAATAGAVGPGGSLAATWELETLRRQLRTPAGVRFPRVPRRRRGHDTIEVDAFLDRIGSLLDAAAEVAVGELRAANFRARRGGYDQDAVDDLLDRLIQLILVSRIDRPGNNVTARPDTAVHRGPFGNAPQAEGRTR